MVNEKAGSCKIQDINRVKNESLTKEKNLKIPYVKVSDGLVNQEIEIQINRSKKDVPVAYCYSLEKFDIKNISNDLIFVEKIDFCDFEYILETKQLIEVQQSVAIKYGLGETSIYQCGNVEFSMRIFLSDVLGNNYYVECLCDYRDASVIKSNMLNGEDKEIVYRKIIIRSVSLPIEVKPKESQDGQN